MSCLQNLTILRQRETTAGLSQSKSRYERFLANQKNLVEAITLVTDKGVLLCDEVGACASVDDAFMVVMVSSSISHPRLVV